MPLPDRSPWACAPAAPPRLSLARWLRRLERGAQRELVLGVGGHLQLSAAEEANVVAQLHHAVLPRLFPPRFAGSVCLLSGLAPGADWLLAQAIEAWLTKAGIPLRHLALLAVPTDLLLRDWAMSLRENGHIVAPPEWRQRQQQIESALRSCATVIDLLPPGTGHALLRSRRFRETQYRRLAACLAQRSDVLLAILRGGHARRPGGTAELVRWRRHPREIPATLSTGERGRPVRPRTIVLDPALSYTAG
jgi:hypothetical protein